MAFGQVGGIGTMLGIVCACLPLMQPIFESFSGHQSKNFGRSYDMMRGDDVIPQDNRDINNYAHPLEAIGISTVV